MCSSTLLTIPWFIGTAIVSMPFVFSFVYKDFWWFTKCFIVFCFVTLGLNSYWLIHTIYPILMKTSGTRIVEVAATMGTQSVTTILVNFLAGLNEPTHQLSQFFRAAWADRPDMAAKDSVGIIFFIVIMAAGILIPRIKSNLKHIYIGALGSFCLAIIFITPNIGLWNLYLFRFLLKHVFLFAMFRNMFDKFGLGLALYYAILLGIAWHMLWSLSKVQQWIKLLAFGTITVVTLYISVTWGLRMYGQEQKRETNISGVFYADALELFSYIKKYPCDGRYLWYPLNTPSYVIIPDGMVHDRYYYGTSPMQFLGGAQDITGFQSFFTQSDPDLNGQIISLLKEKKYKDIGDIYKRLNVCGVISYNGPIPDLQKEQFDNGGVVGLQNQQYREMIFGKKIRDFGSYYSLFDIQPAFGSNKIFLSSDEKTGGTSIHPVTTKKIGWDQYEVTVAPHISENSFLIFKEPFNTFWKLILVTDSGKEIMLPFDHTELDRFGNAWKLNKKDIAKYIPDIDVKPVVFRILFAPRHFTNYGYVITGTTAIGILLYSIWFFKRKKTYE